MSFPCFYNDKGSSVLWFELTEKDDFKDDSAKVVLNCTLLQEGRNTLDIPIYENDAIFRYTAEILKNDVGTRFVFGND